MSRGLGFRAFISIGIYGIHVGSLWEGLLRLYRVLIGRYRHVLGKCRYQCFKELGGVQALASPQKNDCSMLWGIDQVP